jgi:hypothetical protein
MKRQIRKGVFETNSSSTHSITMMMKKDYERWHNEKLYWFDDYHYGWEEIDAPQRKSFYTKNEVIEYLKKNRYYKDMDDAELEDYTIFREAGFIASDDKGNEYLEVFHEEFTTPSGETVVAFGEYGYDG